MNFMILVGFLVFVIPTLCSYALALRAQRMIQAQAVMV